MKSNIISILQTIEPEWHEEFLSYVHTGKASVIFFDYVNRDYNCQQALASMSDIDAKNAYEWLLAFRHILTKHTDIL